MAKRELYKISGHLDHYRDGMFVMGDRAEHITLEGLQYPLTDGTIDCGFPLGVSNHIVAPTARITVGRGPLLVGWELPKSEGEA